MGLFGSQPQFAKPKFWLKKWKPQNVAKVGKDFTLWHVDYMNDKCGNPKVWQQPTRTNLPNFGLANCVCSAVFDLLPVWVIKVDLSAGNNLVLIECCD